MLVTVAQGSPTLTDTNRRDFTRFFFFHAFLYSMCNDHSLWITHKPFLKIDFLAKLSITICQQPLGLLLSRNCKAWIQGQSWNTCLRPLLQARNVSAAWRAMKHEKCCPANNQETWRWIIHRIMMTLMGGQDRKLFPAPPQRGMPSQ